MKTSWIKLLTVGTLTLGASALRLPAADAPAAVIVHEGVTAASLDKTALKDILLGKTAYWEGGLGIIIIVVPDKTEAALQETTGMSASQFRTHWQRLTFSGRGKQPKEADAAEKVVALVAQTKGAIALVPAGTPLQGVKKIELK